MILLFKVEIADYAVFIKNIKNSYTFYNIKEKKMLFEHINVPGSPRKSYIPQTPFLEFRLLLYGEINLLKNLKRQIELFCIS